MLFRSAFSGPTVQPAGSFAQRGASKEAASAFIEAGATIGPGALLVGAAAVAAGAVAAGAAAGAGSGDRSWWCRPAAKPRR